MASTLMTFRIEEETLLLAERIAADAQRLALVDLTPNKVLKTAMLLGLQLMDAKYTTLNRV